MATVNPRTDQDDNPSITLEQALQEFLRPMLVPWWSQLAMRLAVITIGLGLGIAIKLLFHPPLAVAALIGASAIVGLAVWRSHLGQLGNVDWSTAPRLDGPPIPGVGEEAWLRLVRLGAETRVHYPSIDAIYPQLFPCPDGVVTGPCTHLPCRNAGTLKEGRRRVVTFGRLVANLEGEQFEAVLRHEMRHTTGVMAPWAAAKMSLSVAGWFAVGLLPYGLWGALALWFIGGAMSWIAESVCDVAAVRKTSPYAVTSALRGLKTATVPLPFLKRRGRSARLLLNSVLFPSHPPLVVREGVARMVARL